MKITPKHTLVIPGHGKFEAGQAYTVTAAVGKIIRQANEGRDLPIPRKKATR